MADFVDAHLHVVAPDVERYPRQARGVGRDWWTGREVDVDATLRTLDDHHVDRGVIVQAVGPYYDDNRYATDAVAAHPDRLALVAAIVADAPDPARDLQSLLRHSSAVGIRVFGAAGAVPAWLHDARADEICEVATAADINVVVATHAESLAAIARAAAHNPRTPIVLDHCAFADVTGGPGFPNAAPLVELAALANVHLKVSSINLAAANEPTGRAADFVGHLVERFGATRIAWGSDYPQSYEFSYAEMVGLARDSMRSLDPHDAANVLGGTARRLWFNPDNRRGARTEERA